MRCFTAGSLLLLLLQYRAHRQIGSRCHGEVPRPRRKAGQGQDHRMRAGAQRNSGRRAAGIFSVQRDFRPGRHRREIAHYVSRDGFLRRPAWRRRRGKWCCIRRRADSKRRGGNDGAAAGPFAAAARSGGGGSGRGCALLDSPFGCVSAAGAWAGVVASSPANLYNRVASLPFEFGTQTVMPCFPLRAS